MNPRWLVPAALLAGSVYLWFVASNFRGGIGRYEVLGPSFFPKLLLAGLVVVAIVDLGLTVGKKWKHVGYGQFAETKLFYWKDLLLAFAVTIAYVALLRYLGFLPATLLFQFGMLLTVFRHKSWKVVIGVPVFLTALFFVIFSVVMGAPLPRGSGIFYEVSRLIY